MKGGSYEDCGKENAIRIWKGEKLMKISNLGGVKERSLSDFQKYPVYTVTHPVTTQSFLES